MIRNLFCSAVVLGLTLGVALAQDAPAGKVQPGGKTQILWGKITKVNNNMIMFQQYDPKTKEFGKARELEVSGKDLQAFQYGKDNKQVAVKGGLKGEPFTNLDKEGAFARVAVQGNEVRQIWLYHDQDAFRKGMTSNPDTEKGGKN